MSTPHIDAALGDVAETILLPGDPLRAQFIAERYLEQPKQYNAVRNMFGYTGTYRGKPISVQGTGMGMPSALIYYTELITQFKVKRLIRIGSCGALQERLKVHDLIFAMSASTNSHINRLRFGGCDFAACADWELFMAACRVAEAKRFAFRAGNVLSSDEFYGDDPNGWKLWASFGVLAVEMETNGLYTIAAKYGVQALSILTVSDNIVTEEALPPIEREQAFTRMMEIALELAL